MGESSAQRITRLLLEKKVRDEALAAKKAAQDAQLARNKADKKARQR